MVFQVPFFLNRHLNVHKNTKLYAWPGTHGRRHKQAHTSTLTHNDTQKATRSVLDKKRTMEARLAFYLTFLPRERLATGYLGRYLGTTKVSGVCISAAASETGAGDERGHGTLSSRTWWPRNYWDEFRSHGNLYARIRWPRNFLVAELSGKGT